MTDQITFTTPMGKALTIKIVTERENLADHTIMSKCWKLDCTLDGKPIHGKRINHPQHGPAIEIDMGTRWEGKKRIVMVGYALIPADSLAAVDALLARFKAKIEADFNERLASDRRIALSTRIARDMDRPNSDL